jgi:hypothetical protein
MNTVAHVVERRCSTSPTIFCHTAARAKPSGGRKDRRSTRPRRCDRPGRCAGPVGARDQIPDVVLVDEAPRVDQPLGAPSGPVAVGQADSPAAHDRCLQAVDHLRRATDALAPAGGVDDRGGGGLGVSPEGLRQCPHELAQRCLRPGRPRCGWADEQEQRLRLARRQPPESVRAPPDERPAAAASALRLHRAAADSAESPRAVASDTSAAGNRTARVGRCGPEARQHEGNPTRSRVEAPSPCSCRSSPAGARAAARGQRNTVSTDVYASPRQYAADPIHRSGEAAGTRSQADLPACSHADDVAGCWYPTGSTCVAGGNRTPAQNPASTSRAGPPERIYAP